MRKTKKTTIKKVAKKKNKCCKFDIKGDGRWALFAACIATVIVVVGTVYLIIRVGGTRTAQKTNSNNRLTQCYDQNCMLSKFLACDPAELKIDFATDAKYVLSVLGDQNGKCSYMATMEDSMGNIIKTNQDCLIPSTLMTKEAFDHLFGQDKIVGKEDILAQQNQIVSEYCKTS